jgi:hypothetical protein
MARRRHVVEQNKTYSQRILASARAAQAIKVQAQRGRDPPPLQTPCADTRNSLTHTPPLAPFEGEECNLQIRKRASAARCESRK